MGLAATPLAQAAPAAAAVVAHGDNRLPLELALSNTNFPPCPFTAWVLLASGDLPSAPDSGNLDEGIIRILLGAEALGGQQLLQKPIARKPLAREAWALLPAPCPGLGEALPAVLERSQAEAHHLVGRILKGQLARLRTAALSLARAQREAGVELPAPLVARCLASVFVE